MDWVDRFHAKYDRGEPGKCWLWKGALSKGYGLIKADQKYRYAHRLSWQLANGDIPDGLCVLHRCDVRNCVNPNHLFLGTRGDNVYDMIDKGRDRMRSSVPTKEKISPRSVPMVKYLADSGQFRLKDIAEQFGITESMALRIKTGEAYIVRVA